MKKILVPASIIIVLVVGISAWFISRAPKVVYVELTQVYTDFELKKELEGKLDGIKLKRKQILDSLELDLTALSKRAETNDKKAIALFEEKRIEYLQNEQNFSQDNEVMTQEYSGRIWKQLNQYIQDFGKENDYEYILGADGSGAVMYANGQNNITNEVKKYVNQRYKGK